MYRKSADMTGWQRRKARVAKKVTGSTERPRLTVYRSNKHIYAQVVDDSTARTLAATSTITKGFEAKDAKKSDEAKLVGVAIGKLALEKGIEQVVFDRGGNRYHGRIKALAEGAREAGLKF